MKKEWNRNSNMICNLKKQNILWSNIHLAYFAEAPLNKKVRQTLAITYPPVASPSPGLSEPFLPVGPPCSYHVVLIKALLSCCDSSDIVY